MTDLWHCDFGYAVSTSIAKLLLLESIASRLSPERVWFGISNRGR
jgi:hypothetical protein